MSELSAETKARRSLTFGSLAERYDRARPGYPPALADDLLAGGARRVLDVGCGTGKVAQLLADRGCEVLGVEPDERMAEVARRQGVEVEVSAFEDWDAAGRVFDVVVSGTAWHWVDPARGLPTVAAVLPRGGLFSVFWNGPVHDAHTRAVLDAAYAAAAPELADVALVLGRAEERNDLPYRAPIDESGLFEPAELRRYRHGIHYTREEWLELAFTHSDHIVLPAEGQAALRDALGRALDELGGELDVTYETVALLAHRL